MPNAHARGDVDRAAEGGAWTHRLRVSLLQICHKRICDGGRADQGR
jgi:hypothetical protein